MRPGDRVLAVLAGLATAVLLGFILLPLVAIFVKVPPGELLSQLRSPVALEALRVSVKTSLIAVGLILALGTPAAYVLGTRTFWGSSLIATLLEIPLVLPPAVAGLGLFAAFGRLGLLGGTLHAFGVSIPFTQAAVVMALAFVASPLYVRQALSAFASLDPQLMGASRTLGAGAGATFARVAIPLARPSLSAGTALALARALGEFGATLMFAGSLQGRTQTLSLAIYEEFSRGDLEAALAMSVLLITVSVGLLVGIRLLVRRSRRAEPPLVWRWNQASTSTSATG